MRPDPATAERLLARAAALVPRCRTRLCWGTGPACGRRGPRSGWTIPAGPLREALSVPQPGRVAGRRVLVFDDVYSEGYSRREMARALRRAGAAEVAGLVLTRRKGC